MIEIIHFVLSVPYNKYGTRHWRGRARKLNDAADIILSQINLVLNIDSSVLQASLIIASFISFRRKRTL